MAEATGVSAEQFLHDRMKNRIKKVLGRNWEILHETPQYVYYGYTLPGKGGEKAVTKIFKTDKPNLEKVFPAYAVYDGKVALKLIGKILSANTPKVGHNMIQDFKWSASFSDGKILLKINREFSIDGAKKKFQSFQVFTDAKTMKIIKARVQNSNSRNTNND